MSACRHIEGDFPSRIWEIWTGSDTLRAGWLSVGWWLTTGPPLQLWLSVGWWLTTGPPWQLWLSVGWWLTTGPPWPLWLSIGWELMTGQPAGQGSYGWLLASILGNFTKPSSLLDGS